MRVRFTKGQTHYNQVLVVNRGEFEMASIMVDQDTGLYSATAFDWSTGAPYETKTIIADATLAETRSAVKAYLEPLPEPPAY